MTEQPWTILRPHRIRWAECDLYGHVNHAAYLTMFEDLRVDHWQALTGTQIAPHLPGPVVAQIEARYIRAVGFGDLVTLACRTSSFRRTSFVHDYALLKDDEPCCTARAICVVTRQDTGEKVPLWDTLRATLREQGAAEG
jgi:YbgC/YbaW family acyl-CoA thioester hydrolase